MLSVVIDSITQSSYDSISMRKEFFLTSSKRRDKIIRKVAVLPFLVRTILLIDDTSQRDTLLRLSIFRHVVLCKETVGLWLNALLSGDERAKSCAMHYICIVSRLSLSSLYGQNIHWSSSDLERFHYSRAELFDEIKNLSGFLPTMLHLGDQLYVVATRRAVKHIVEGTIGRPLPVYLMFMEMSFLLTLMTSYRMIVDLIYLNPSEMSSSLYPEFWGLAMSIATYFLLHDLMVVASLGAIEQKLSSRFIHSFGNVIGFISIVSVLAVLSVLYCDGNVQDNGFLGIVAGLLWWKFLIHTKGMSEHLSTLIYTIIKVSSCDLVRECKDDFFGML